MKEIKSLSGITEKKTLLFISSDSCSFCQKIQPVVEEFEKKHPEVEVILTKTASHINQETHRLNEDMLKIVGGNLSTPTFVFFKDQKPYNILRGGFTTLEQFETALDETPNGVLGLVDFELIKKWIKPVLLFAFKPDCPTCDEVNPVMKEFADKNPMVQVLEIPSSPELKSKMGITQTIDLPLIAYFEMGNQSTKINTGKIDYAELVSFVEEAKKSMQPQGQGQPCKHEQENVELKAEIKRLNNQIEKLIDKLTK